MSDRPARESTYSSEADTRGLSVGKEETGVSWSISASVVGSVNLEDPRSRLQPEFRLFRESAIPRTRLRLFQEPVRGRVEVVFAEESVRGGVGVLFAEDSGRVRGRVDSRKSLGPDCRGVGGLFAEGWVGAPRGRGFREPTP
ncbi:unnamed protein product [Didymodactylos carnosus]|uniref:Uncharacterized protein n=1 Tax=Didymodactylos carnosus TaxID=1234261 RepID=A0A815EBZ4_9BILA|nr:unnamed protein product [Didymodactylos carnosus]CAF4145792.1 unnamed protein product [Didymodactylos carnosus]